jgi:hypothetical protein
MPPKQSKKKQQQQQKKARKVASAAKPPRPGIHPLAASFLNQVVSNTATRSVRPLGLPYKSGQDSWKCRGFVDFTMSTGTDGTGFVLVNPSVANNQRVVTASTSTWAGSVIPNMDTADVTVFSAVMANLPYNAASFTGTNRGRIVDCSLTMQCNAANMTAQGHVYGLHESTHSSLAGLNEGGMRLRTECVKKAVANKAQYHLFGHPVTDPECNYSQPASTVTSCTWNPVATAGVMGFWVKGAQAAAPATFDCCLTYVVELTGTFAEANESVNPLPPAGLMDHAMHILHQTASKRARSPELPHSTLAKYACQLYKAANSPMGRGILAGVGALVI